MSGSQPFVTRAGEKLSAALTHFQFSVEGLICADLGSHAGGFVDCLLQAGAAKVYSVDTSYGTLAWKLRKDPRVAVMERTNAMHVQLPEPVDVVTIDVAWTRQFMILPNAKALLKPGGTALTLIKPHYESDSLDLIQGVLPENKFDTVVDRVCEGIRAMNWIVDGTFVSPLQGHGGNREVFARLRASSN